MHLETIEFYDAHSEEIAARYHKADVSELHNILHRWLPDKGDILEIGCGCGREAIFIASLGCDVMATDASDNMLQQANRNISASTYANKVKLDKATFPLPSEHKLLKDRFDAIVCIAVVMHIPNHELFEFAYQIRTMIKEKGIFICSFCTEYEAAHNDPRLYINRESTEISLLFERLGFRILATNVNADGLNRERMWTTLTFSSEGQLGTRPVDQIESIINRDKKTATYKLALLRALCEIAQTSFHCARFIPGDRVAIPLGLIVEKWLYYYWPLVDTELIFPEMQIGRARGMAFRTALLKLVNSFKPGGLNAFYALFQSGRLNKEQIYLLTQAVNIIANTIIVGPVTYAGGSIKDIDNIFRFNGIKRISHCSIPIDLIKGFGDIVFPASLWHEMCFIGHWIGEAIILRWAELSCKFAKYEVSIPAALERLIIRPESDRDVTRAKDIYSNSQDLICVWSGKSLKSSRFDVDHVMPYVFWHNNDLWNLMPTDPKINNQKREKIVTLETLHSSKDRIIHYWHIANVEAPIRFRTEIGRTLFNGLLPNYNWEIPAFTALSEAIETLAIKRGVERWAYYE